MFALPDCNVPELLRVQMPFWTGFLARDIAADKGDALLGATVLVATLLEPEHVAEVDALLDETSVRGVALLQHRQHDAACGYLWRGDGVQDAVRPSICAVD